MLYIYSMGKRLLFFVVCIFVFGSLPLGAQGFFGKISWFAEGSVLFFPDKNGLYSDPWPILPSPGMGASYPFTDRFRMELTLDMYWTNYRYSDELCRAVPAAIENRSAQVIGPLLGIQGAAYFNVTSLLTVRVFGGPAADLRIVFIASDLRSDDMDEASRHTKSVRRYFWSSARWLMPVLGSGIDFAINPRFKIGLDLRIWMPVYRLWTGENLSAIDGWRFGVGLRFTVLRKPGKPEESAK